MALAKQLKKNRIWLKPIDTLNFLYLYPPAKAGGNS